MSNSGCEPSRTVPVAQSFIAGHWVAGGPARPIINPADLRDTVGEVHPADAELARDAMEAAARVWPDWRQRPVDERLGPLAAVLDLLHAQRDTVARTITLENGKTLCESHAEIDATIRDGQYQLQVARESPTRVQAERARPDVCSEVRYEPVGMFLLITPWNFPLATIVRKLVPAVALGNTVVVKPAEITPLTAACWFGLLEQAGLPASVANLVIGKSSVVGSTLVNHPALRGISFTGSTEVGLRLCRQVADRDVRLQMEMGGKNALVILADADLDAAVEAATFAAFSCAGQWCVSTSRVIVERPIYERFLEALCDRVARIRVGNGMNDATDMGPVISADQFAQIEQAIGHAKTQGARLLFGGETIAEVAGTRGYYVQPTVFADVTEHMKLASEEVFGPVLAVMPAGGPEDALRLANATQYGLSFSVYTRDVRAADRFMEGVEAGMCHVNLPTPYREPGLPLGGWRESGRGVPECGEFAREFFTRVKAVYRAEP